LKHTCPLASTYCLKMVAGKVSSLLSVVWSQAQKVDAYMQLDYPHCFPDAQIWDSTFRMVFWGLSTYWIHLCNQTGGAAHWSHQCIHSWLKWFLLWHDCGRVVAEMFEYPRCGRWNMG
jgi:hypothetical protein